MQRIHTPAQAGHRCAHNAAAECHPRTLLPQSELQKPIPTHALLALQKIPAHGSSSLEAHAVPSQVLETAQASAATLALHNALAPALGAGLHEPMGKVRWCQATGTVETTNAALQLVLFHWSHVRLEGFDGQPTS